jgi:hypothetical protein
MLTVGAESGHEILSYPLEGCKILLLDLGEAIVKRAARGTARPLHGSQV